MDKDRQLRQFSSMSAASELDGFLGASVENEFSLTENDSALTILKTLDKLWFWDNIVRPAPWRSKYIEMVTSQRKYESVELPTPVLEERQSIQRRKKLRKRHRRSMTDMPVDDLSRTTVDASVRKQFSPHSSAKETQNHPVIQRFPKLETIPSDKPLQEREVLDLEIQQTSMRRRERQRATKSMSDLEFTEVKGLMDLGFKFNMNDLSPHIVNMLPGLQRLGGQGKTQTHPASSPVSRPYLSEAWLIHRSDSPLLNLRMPSLHDEGVDMKEQLKFWARAVASTIQQES